MPETKLQLKGTGKYSLIQVTYPQSQSHYRQAIFNETLRALGVLIDLTDDGDQYPETATKALSTFVKKVVLTPIRKNRTLVETTQMENEEAYAINLLYCPSLRSMALFSPFNSEYDEFEEITNNILFFANYKNYEIRKYNGSAFDYIRMSAPWGEYVRLIARENETSVMVFSTKKLFKVNIQTLKIREV